MFLILLVLDAKAIEHEHPLVDLELIDVQLAHELDDLDGLFFEFIIDSDFFVVEGSDQLGLQMRPQEFESICQFALAQTQHQDPHEQEQRHDKGMVLVASLEAIDHLFEQRVKLLANLVLFGREDQEAELSEDLRLPDLLV